MKIQNFSMRLVIVLCIMIAFASCENKTQAQDQKILRLGTQIDVTLEAQKKATINLKIDRPVNESESLFITAQSPYNDPFEEPTIYVTSDKNFQQACHEEASDFIGICQIQGENLKEGRVFSIQLYCEVDCELKVTAYISSVYQLNLGDSNWLKNYEKTALVLGFEVEIPSTQNFTEFLILAQPTSTQDILEGTTMFANFGEKPKLPTNSEYSVKSVSVSQHRIGIFLSSAQVKPGERVSFLVVIAPNVELTLSTKIINQDTYRLYIGSPIYDFTTADQKRIYILDLQEYETPNQTFDETILLKFISFSGNPTITVSLDIQFSENKILQRWEGLTAHSYEITPERRKQIGQEKKIYVKVESFWSTNFQLEASVNRKPFIDLEAQITELFHVEPKKMKNLIFLDENYAADLPQDGIVEYKMSIQVSKDSVGFRLRNCGAFKEGNVLDCVIEKDEELSKDEVKKSFSEIQFTQTSSSSTHILIFKYNVKSKCESSGDQSATKKYSCKFHILITNDNSESENVNVQFTINKDTIKQWLREGHMEKGTVMQGSWNYYAFSLPSVENIVKIEFYATVIQGDVTLLLSQNKAYPSFEEYSDADNDIQYSIWNSIILSNEDIKEGFYYIGIYGNSMTDYSLGVAIERLKRKNDTNPDDKNNTNDNKNNSQDDIADITQIRLEKGVVQTINMPMGKTTAKFVFSPMEDKENSVVKIIQTQGHVDYSVKDKQDGKQVCDSKVLVQNGDDQCQFQSAFGRNYLVTVLAGDKDEVQVFTIVYTTQQICGFYPWNFPLQVVINPNETACLTYKMYELEDIHIALSLSPLQLLTLNLAMEVKFAKKSLKITEHEKIISKKELQLLCKSKQDESCTFTIKLSYPSKNAEDQSSSFLIAVENYRSQNVLFESIASRVTTEEISQTVSNNYFYYVFQDNRYKDLSILLTSQTASKYQIAAKVLSNSQFVRDTNSSLYPKFNQQNATIIVNSTENSPITVLSINAEQFIKTPDNSQLTVVLISVFGMSAKSKSKKMTYVYSIEVNQGTDTLLLGDSRIGTISKDSVYEYEVDLFNSESSTVEVRSLSDDDCLNSYIYNPFKSDQPSELNDVVAFNQEYGVRVILLKTDADYCSYQISFNSLDLPIQNVVPSVPYDAVVQDEKAKYYSYYHTDKNSFIVLQMITAGSSYLYVESIKPKDNIENALKRSLEEYTYSSDMNGDLQISNKSAGFCTNCYYLIAVQGHPSAKAELTINPYDVPILLKEQAPLRDRLQVDEANHYQFYAKSNFVVSLSILYGKVNMTVKDYTGKQVAEVNQIFDAQDVEIVIEKPTIEGNNFFDEKTKYLIEVKTGEDTSYYIDIKKTKQGVVKAYEGLPLNLELEKDVKLEIQFYNIHKTGFTSLLVEDLDYYDLLSQNKLTFQARKDNDSVLNNVVKSENNYNVQLKAIEGRFIITIVSEMSTQVSLIFARKQFNHLQAARTYFMDKPSIFEIYSPGDSIIIQIYSCRDDVEVRASSNFTLLMTETQNENGIVRMEHANYGGHYVIVADKLKGEYFLETSPLYDDQTELSYLITYHLFNPEKGDKMPYRSYGINNPQVNYKYYIGGVEFLLSRVRRKDDSSINSNVTYKLYISNSSADIQRITKCSLGKVYTATQNVQITTTGTLSFKFDTSQIQEIVGKSQTYLVGAEATVMLADNDSTHIQQVNFVYELAQLTINTQIQLKSESKIEQIQNVGIWIVFPFVVGAILLYFAARYLIRSFSAYPTQLVEEDDNGVAGQSQEVIPANQEAKGSTHSNL